MLDPIRPEDHSIEGLDVLRAIMAAGRMDQISGPERALTEAIHQTFERDAKAERLFVSATERYERAQIPPKPNKWNEGVRLDEEDGEPMQKPCRRHFKSQPNPDTETDRQARLIVNGEYRRRADRDGKQS